MAWLALSGEAFPDPAPGAAAPVPLVPLAVKASRDADKSSITCQIFYQDGGIPYRL